MNKELGITMFGSNETPTEWTLQIRLPQGHNFQSLYTSYTTCCINFSLTIHNSGMCHTQKYRNIICHPNYCWMLTCILPPL